jgi:hypothetical protein
MAFPGARSARLDLYLDPGRGGLELRPVGVDRRVLPAGEAAHPVTEARQQARESRTGVLRRTVPKRYLEWCLEGQDDSPGAVWDIDGLGAPQLPRDDPAAAGVRQVVTPCDRQGRRHLLNPVAREADQSELDLQDFALQAALAMTGYLGRQEPPEENS